MRLAAAFAALPGVLALGENPGVCVATKCTVPLAECEINTVCRTWEGCVTGCTGVDPLPCQIRCADLYHPTDATAAAIDKFSECAISTNHCVAQTGSASDCKPPANAGSLPAFDQATLASVAGGNSTWFVTRGHNPLFDCFDCQVHTFSMVPQPPPPAGDPAAKTLFGDLAYLVKKDLGCNSTAAAPCPYLPRLVHQGWRADAGSSAHLINSNNSLAEMHYSDDWYVLASRDDTYVLVYYCGCNDANCGYGGAVLYTRDPDARALADGDKAALAAALVAADVGFTFDSMCTPNNIACS